MADKLKVLNLVYMYGPANFSLLLGKYLEQSGLGVFYLSKTPLEHSLLKANVEADRILSLPLGSADSKESEVDDSTIDRYMATHFHRWRCAKPRFRPKRSDYSYFRRVLGLYQQLDETYGFDFFLFWNISFFTSALAQLYCDMNNKPKLILEDGFFRPATIVADRQGVNFHNSASRDRNFYLNRTGEGRALSEDATDIREAPLTLNTLRPAHELWLRFVSFVKSRTEPTAKFCRAPISLSEGRAIRSARRRMREAKPEELNDLNDFILVPFQVRDDSQIVVFSPWIKDMESLVESLTSPMAALKREGKYSNTSLVFKEHPADWGRVDYSGLYRKYAGLNWVRFVRKAPMEPLLEKARAVVTVNSTVGIEALNAGKPVLTLGEAFFNIEGLVLHAKVPEEVRKKLHELSTFTPEEPLRRGFIDYLRSDYLKTVNWKNPSHLEMTRFACWIDSEFSA